MTENIINLINTASRGMSSRKLNYNNVLLLTVFADLLTQFMLT